MNLKSAFHYQNVLTNWFNELVRYLSQVENVTTIDQTHLLSKVIDDAADDVLKVKVERRFPYDNTRLMRFVIELLEEKVNLSTAITSAKRNSGVDIDTSVAINKLRQEATNLFRTMASIKTSENITPGVRYKFNADGNQVSYRYDIKEVTKIDFDRAYAREKYRSLSAESDKVSSTLDLAMLTIEVIFAPKFDANYTLDDIFTYKFSKPEK